MRNTKTWFYDYYALPTNVAFPIRKDIGMGSLAVQIGMEGLFEIEREMFRLSAPNATFVDKTSRRTIQEPRSFKGDFVNLKREILMNLNDGSLYVERHKRLQLNLYSIYLFTSSLED